MQENIGNVKPESTPGGGKSILKVRSKLIDKKGRNLSGRRRYSNRAQGTRSARPNVNRVQASAALKQADRRGEGRVVGEVKRGGGWGENRG